MPEKLSVRRREAAQMLSISVRTLERLTASGEIPCVRLDRGILYSVEALREWLGRKMAENEGRKE